MSLGQLKLKTLNFVHLLATWSVSLRIHKYSLKWTWSRSRGLFKFWKIIDNILEMVQDKDTVTMKD